jgi:trans-2,3-dihydro-3-hydroxyanthranilate isomerase
MRPHRTYRFVQVDVFTNHIFGGNPLAVFPAATGLTDAEMQAIAKEMNLSETTFILPPARTDCVARVRIFTPARELPFAGHPTLGTAFVLATQSMLAGAQQIALEEGVGPVPVRLEGDPSAPSFIWMRHAGAAFGPELGNRLAFARALGLMEADLLKGTPIQVGSTGLPFLYIPLRDRAAVDQAVLHVPTLLDTFDDPTAGGVFIFALDPTAGRVYARMFAPHTIGVDEDPATGSASGPLGAYLVQHGLVAGNDEIHIISEQGTKMGRQSFIHIRLRQRGGQTHEIEVGGSVVSVLEGVLRLG